jgi:predicted KAP-like P-loop ATPase
LYNPDRAIKDIQQDRLGRSSFSKHLGQDIYGYTGAEGLVIGLYGKWGTIVAQL